MIPFPKAARTANLQANMGSVLYDEASKVSGPTVMNACKSMERGVCMCMRVCGRSACFLLKSQHDA